MKKTFIQIGALLILIASGFILTYQGFGMSSVSPAVHLILRLLAGLSVQTIFILNFPNPLFRAAPLVISGLLALWGGYLLLTSPAWENATIFSYLADYCTPILGSVAAMVLIPKILPEQ